MSVETETRHLEWPFLDSAHATLARDVHAWAREQLPPDEALSIEEVDTACRRLVQALASAGLLHHCVAGDGGFDARSICVIREALAYHSGLADFAFAMQGLGSGAISLFGSADQKSDLLPGVADGSRIAAFALSEPDAGSDVAAMQSSARRDGDHYVLNGTKTWISNGGIADFYCVFARTGDAAVRADGRSSAGGITAFVVEADTPGLSVDERIEVIAPHPLATLGFDDCRVAASNRIGDEGDGFRIAMATLDVFRSSVAAAATGFARRALAEALRHAEERRLFGQQLKDLQMTQAALADMATGIDASALLTYRAAWLRDRGENFTQAAAMAKLTATESAQVAIDRAVQMFGGRGVRRGEIVEQLYREIRALRIYEGASEVQKLIISRELLRGAGGVS